MAIKKSRKGVHANEPVPLPAPTIQAEPQAPIEAPVSVEATELRDKISALEKQVGAMKQFVLDALNDLSYLAKITHNEYAQRRHREATEAAKGLL